MCSLAICWYIVLTTGSLLGVNDILLLWSKVFDSCDILRLFAGQAGFRRYYQEKMASPEKMPQVVCWTLLLITVLQISFVSWTVVNELEDLKVLKLEKRHGEWRFNQWINVLQVLVLHGFSWHCWMGQIRWIWGFDCVHELWSCDTVNRNYFFRPGTDLRCLRLSFFVFSKLSEFAFEFSKKTGCDIQVAEWVVSNSWSFPNDLLILVTSHFYGWKTPRWHGLGDSGAASMGHWGTSHLSSSALSRCAYFGSLLWIWKKLYETMKVDETTSWYSVFGHSFCFVCGSGEFGCEPPQ